MVLIEFLDMKKLALFFVSPLLFSCIQKQIPTDFGKPTNDVVETDTIIETVALIEDDTLFDAVYGVHEYPMRVKALSVAPHHNFDCHNERIMAVVSYKDTLILITDDEHIFHDITFKEDSLRKSFPKYHFYGSDEDDVPYTVFIENEGDTICFILNFDDNLLYLEDAYISIGPFSVGPFHVGMTQMEMADSIGIPIEMTKVYKCIALLHGCRFTLFRNLKAPKLHDYPEYTRIIISYSDIITKITVTECNLGGRVLCDPYLHWF